MPGHPDRSERLGERPLEARFRDLAKMAHPDKGGSPEAMVELNQARDEMRAHYAR